MEKYIITKGYSHSDYELNAFDCALHLTGISDYNLVRISSILPAGCRMVYEVDLPKGSILYTAYSSYIESRSGLEISAAVAIALPKDPLQPGVIMETSGLYDINVAEQDVISMCRIAMKVRGVVEFDIISEATSMKTKSGYNCIFAAVAMW